MNLGEKCMLKISPNYGYGDSNLFFGIPPNSSLTFEIELLEITFPKITDMAMDYYMEDSRDSTVIKKNSKLTLRYIMQIKENENGLILYNIVYCLTSNKNIEYLLYGYFNLRDINVFVPEEGIMNLILKYFDQEYFDFKKNKKWIGKKELFDKYSNLEAFKILQKELRSNQSM